jgi:hypothetical protein
MAASSDAPVATRYHFSQKNIPEPVDVIARRSTHEWSRGSPVEPSEELCTKLNFGSYDLCASW